MKAVIRRCPATPAIRAHAEETALALEENLDVKVEIADGLNGEFTVFMDETPVAWRSGPDLPAPGTVVSAVEESPALKSQSINPNQGNIDILRRTPKHLRRIDVSGGTKP